MTDTIVSDLQGVLQKISVILDVDGEKDAVDNLNGVIADWEYFQKFDEISLKTLKRVLGQIDEVRALLK
jgi:hypothetical protein